MSDIHDVYGGNDGTKSRTRREALAVGAGSVVFGGVLGRLTAGSSVNELPDSSGEIAPGTVKFTSITTPEEFGASGDGIADDTQSVQDALDSGKPVFFGAKYMLRSRGPILHSAKSWHRYLTVNSGARLFGPGEFQYEIPYESRGMVLSLHGNDVRVEGLTFTNLIEETVQPWSIAIGMSPDRDSELPSSSYSDIVITGCTFRNDFAFVSFDMPEASPSVSHSLSGVRIENCTGFGHPYKGENAGTGCFDGHHISDVSYVGNSTVGGTFAASYNMVGVRNGLIAGNLAKLNKYAGIQVENECGDIAISGNTIVDCNYGIWVDDSERINVNGNSISSDGSGALAIFISFEGTSNNPEFTTDYISIASNTIFGVPIRMGSFGTRGGGNLGHMSIVNNVVVCPDNIPNAMSLSSCRSVIVAGNSLSGGSEATVALGTMSTQTTLFSNNLVFGSGSGVTIHGDDGTESFSNNLVENSSWSVSGDQVGNRVGGRPAADVRAGVRDAIGEGEPDGRVSAPIGSVYRRSDGTSGSVLYIKERGEGASGWVAK